MADSCEDIRTPADLAREFDGHAEADAGIPVVLGAAGPVSRARIGALADELADELAGALADAPPMAPGSVIGVAAVGGSGFLAAVLAVWKRSCTALLIDAETPEERRDALLGSFGAAAAVGCALPTPGDVSEFEVQVRGTGTATLEGAAVIKLTSGSTGAPRGIVLSPAAVAADTSAIESAMGIGDHDRVLAAVPMSFSYGFGSVAVPALLRGRQIVVPDEGPLGNLTAAEEFGATVMPTVPAFLSALLKRGGDRQLPPTLRLILSAGAPLTPDVARRFRERFGQPVHVFYGASECGGITYDRNGDAAERGTVGEPVPGVDVVVDEESGRVTVRSPAVAEGYLPAEPGLGDGVFTTSDLAEWSGGELRLVGREGALINVRGHKVNPREVEEVIGALPGVAAVVVTGMPTEAADTETCCALVESDDASVSRQRVHEWCLAKLPSFKLPRHIVIVQQIPRNGRGKVRREAVRELLAGDAG